jgi:hypothetical protein
MALIDLIKPTPESDRPPGITCDKYTRSESTRCVHYLSNGSCARADEFMCVEWLKKHGPLAPRQEGRER